LPREKIFAESLSLGSRQRALCWEPHIKYSAKNESQSASSRQRISLPSAFPRLSTKKLKKHFLPLIFFYHQHTLIQRICSKLAQF
jgi:hypothetical protein